MNPEHAAGAPDAAGGPEHDVKIYSPGAKPKRSTPVFVYLLILFAAAFLMLLLAYFIQERNTEAQIGDLRDSLEAFQSISALTAENQELREQLDELEEDYRALSDALEQAGAERDQARQERNAADEKLAGMQRLIDRLAQEGLLARSADGEWEVVSRETPPPAPEGR